MINLKEKQNIPEGWKQQSLLDCLNVPSKLAGIKLSEYEKEGDFPVFDQGQDYISGYSSKDDLVIKNVPAILFGDHTRVVKYIKSPFVVGADGTKIFWAKDNFDPTFLYYLVLNQKIPNTGYNRHFKFFKDIKVLLPESKKEQQKIAGILGVVDEDIAKTQEVIKTTEKLKRGLMQQLFTRGIGHTKFKQMEIGEIPEGWNVVKGENISSIITKGASPKWQGFNYQKDGMVFVTSENVRGGYLDLRNPKFLPIAFHEKIKNSQLKKGDILINIVGASIGRSCKYSSQYEYANINQAVCLFRTKDGVSEDFILQYLQNPDVITRLLGSQGGSARPNLSLTDIRNFLFVFPEKEEQNKIAEILSAVDEKKSVNKELLAKLTDLKKGLMQDLLSGDKRVKI